MLDNHLYNLASTLTEESRSLWRLKNTYKDEAQECKKCEEIFDEIIQSKERDIEKLKELLKEHL